LRGALERGPRLVSGNHGRGRYFEVLSIYKKKKDWAAELESASCKKSEFDSGARGKNKQL